jgi:hypothetical protein
MASGKAHRREIRTRPKSRRYSYLALELQTLVKVVEFCLGTNPCKR